MHCAADGLKNPPLVPVWTADAITLQPIRAGFPCFGAAIGPGLTRLAELIATR